MTRVFFDMDGVLAEYKQLELSELYKKGYFKKLKPYKESLKAIKKLSANPEFEVYTLSAYLADSKYALKEKKFWFKKHFRRNNITPIFVPCGQNKSDAVPGGIRPTDILVDDYNVNLRDWQEHAVAIKFLNGINHKHGSWKGLTAKNDSDDITEVICRASA